MYQAQATSPVGYSEGCVASKQPEIAGQLERLAATIDGCEAALSGLIQRLEPVLTPEPPSNQAGPTIRGADGPMSETAARLLGLSERVQRIADYAHRTRNRVEV